MMFAKPGMAQAFRERTVVRVRAVRAEPGCVTFTAYEARDLRGRFQLYEFYDNAAAFDDHSHTAHVREFIAPISAPSTGGPGELRIVSDENL